MAKLVTLVAFDGSNGSIPKAGVIFDGSGNLLGTTSEGGAYGERGSSNYGYGTVFEIAETNTGYASTPTTLFSFDGSDCTDGSLPLTGLIADSAGNLFGTSAGGYTRKVFELANTSTGYASAPTTHGVGHGPDRLPRAAKDVTLALIGLGIRGMSIEGALTLR